MNFDPRTAIFRDVRRRERHCEQKHDARIGFETQECVTLTQEQRAEVDRRVEAHAERVRLEMLALGMRCNATLPAEETRG